MTINMKSAHKNISIPQRIASCFANYDIESKIYYVISDNSYDIQYEIRKQTHMDIPTYTIFCNFL